MGQGHAAYIVLDDDVCIYCPELDPTNIQYYETDFAITVCVTASSRVRVG